MKISIRWKLILSICLPLLIVYAAALIIDYNKLKSVAYKQMENYLMEIVSHEADRINAQFSAVAQIAKSTADFFTLDSNYSERDLYTVLKENLNQNELIYGAAVAFKPYSFDSKLRLFSPYVWRDSKSGRMEQMDIGKGAYDYSGWEWFKGPAEKKQPIWTEPFFDKNAGDIVMSTYSAPFFLDDSFRGVTTVDVDLNGIQEWASSSQRSFDGFAILSKEGRFISHPNPSYIMKETVLSVAKKSGRTDLSDFLERILSGRKGVERLKDFPFEGPQFIAYAPVKSTGWVFAAVVSETKVMAPVWKDLTSFLGFMLLSLLVIVLIVLIASFKITKPILTLSNEFGQVTSGNLDFQSNQKYPDDEIGQLAGAFRRMIKALKTYLSALTAETAARESVESELRVARNIQSSLLPQTFPPYPEKKEFELHAINVPARHVAGDFFDFFFITEDELVLVIADVSGKGVPAAMMMAVTRTLIRNLASQKFRACEVINRVNKTISMDNEYSLFVTLMLVFYNVKTGKIYYANAGHPLPHKICPNGDVTPFGQQTGTVLGVFEDVEYEIGEGELGIEETLVFYTDGITEARAKSSEFFGQDRFVEFLKENYQKSVQPFSENIFDYVKSYQNNELADDVTLMILRRSS